MRTPPLLLGATLLFWGWQTGWWPLALVAAVSLEGARVGSARWEFSPADFNRIWNLCTVLFLGAALFILATNEGGGAITGLFRAAPGTFNEALNKTSRSALVLFQWLPLIFFPFVAAQAYSVRDTVAPSTFSWWLRRKQAQARTQVTRAGVNVSHHYFAVCLLSASATNQRTPWFYAGLAVLLAWSFWPLRSRRWSVAAWCGLLAGVIALGYVGQLGLNRLQKIVENLDVAWLARFAGGEFDPKESRTSLGAIGKLKLSGRIVLRVETGGEAPPALLREASYTLFRSPTWHGTTKDFAPVPPEADETTWRLQRRAAARHVATIAHYLRQGSGLLALPLGVAQIEALPVALLETNRLGVVRVSGGPGLVRYRATYDGGASFDGPPDADDLQIPETEAAALAQVARELGLANQSPPEALRTVAGFFQEHFQYSTDLRAPASASQQTALARFLLQDRAGHCAYFATATTLLLRAAKIPARYAAGYSVQEAAGKGFVVRDRHAHAWCLVHVNGAWRELDTTPASWSAAEESRASFWEPLSDAWSRLWFEFSKWRWSQTRLQEYLPAFAGLLLVAFLGQLIFKKQWTRARPAKKGRIAPPVQPGTDSEFYAIEESLLARGLHRPPGEPLAAWVRRVAPTEPLPALVALHDRLRFDPNGLSTTDRSQLRAGVRAWLDSNEQSASNARSGR